MKRRRKHTPKNPASARPRKRNIGESEPVRRPASSAPAPIETVGVSYRLPRSKPTQMPLDWPAYYPNDLISQTEKVVAEAVKEFREQTQITELCEWVVSTLTPDFCAAVQGKTLRADLASYRMDNLLDCLLRYNCDDLEKRYQLKKQVVNSDEWKKLVDEIARVHSAGQPQRQPGETRGHKGAKHVTEPPKEESKKRLGKKLLPDQATTVRPAMIDSFIAKVEHEEGKKITRKDIWTVAGYGDRTEFQRFQCGHKKATPTSKQKFDRVLAMEPQAFIQALNKKQEKK